VNIPENLKYTKDHEWAKIEGDFITVGITDFAQSELGDIIFVEYPEIGQEVSAGDPFGTIEAVKTVADLFSPVDGTILAVNDEIEDAPDAVNTDPYGRGWLVKISVDSMGDELMTADHYKEFVSQ